MYDILVLGLMYPEGSEDEVLCKSKASTVQFAANAHLKMLIDGVESVIDDGVKILNILPVGSYPKRYADSFIKEFKFAYGKSVDNVNVGYCNITIIKQLSKPYALKKHIKKWTEDNSRGKKVVLVYTIEPEFLSVLGVIKKNSDAHICQIVTDLPDYTDIDKGGRLIYRLATKCRVALVKKRVGYADSFVFLAEAMAEYFDTDKPYIVMEGLVSGKEVEYGKYEVTDKKTIVYTGTLTKKYGIMELVNAFRMIDKENYRLVICGSGEAEEDILSLDDDRIEFLGAVVHSEARRIQAMATVLINPRNDREEFTKYSFPSKIMEYMMSARPVLCFKLKGIPDEYDEYLNYFECEDTEGMARDIVRLCEKSEGELSVMGEKARKFVLENKNEYVQAKKMLGMIEKNI